MEDFLKHSDLSFYTKRIPVKLPHIAIPFSYSKEIIPIFKEAITNSYKHANAKSITFKVEYLNDTIKICLIDDGKGFDCSKKNNGNGLENMSKRAGKLAGADIIINSDNKGTIVCLTIQNSNIFSV
jgi:signal transduction histidine kinase